MLQAEEREEERKKLAAEEAKKLGLQEEDYDTELISNAREVYAGVVVELGASIGKAVSKRERNETDQSEDFSLTYGEVTFEAFAEALMKVRFKYGLPGVGSSSLNEGIMQELLEDEEGVKITTGPGAGGRFYDLGSGTGKVLVAACCLHAWDLVRGVEILEGLHNCAILEALPSWESKGKNKLSVAHQNYDTTVDYLMGDLRDVQVTRSLALASSRENTATNVMITSLLDFFFFRSLLLPLFLPFFLASALRLDKRRCGVL